MKNRIIYWASTCLVAFPLLCSGIIYLVNPSIIESAHPNMGFPDYFKTELGVAKILGALALLLPISMDKIKEFAYAGFTIVLFSAFITHIAINDTIKDILIPIIIFCILAISYIYWNKIKKNN